MSWLPESDSQLENYTRLLLVGILVAWNWLVATRIETPYPSVIVDLYAVPLTRIALLSLVLLSGIWCPSIAVLAALAYVSLGADVIFFTH